MKIALLATVCNDWSDAAHLIREVENSREKFKDHELSVWLIDDGSSERPDSWSALATSGLLSCHVMELQGSHGHQRALATALGFLVYEMEADFDAFLLLGDRQFRLIEIEGLLETSAEHAGAIVSSRGSGAPIFGNWFFRACTGKSIGFGPMLFIPNAAAEILCHSSYTGNHLAASIIRLDLPHVTVPAAYGKQSKETSTPLSRSTKLSNGLAALSVFRDIAMMRATVFLFGFCALLGSLIILGLALRMSGAMAIPAWMIAIPVLAFFFSLPLAVVMLVLALQGFSHRELRTWTPALNSSALVRSVNRIRRGPYDLAPKPQSQAGS